MEKTLGQLIAERRKELGMTQAQVAAQMSVTDKAVSKWERDLSCPDIGSIPKLAKLLQLSPEELLEGRREPEKNEVRHILSLVLRAVALAMGVAVTVLSGIGKLDGNDAVGMLGIGLTAAALYLLEGRE